MERAPVKYETYVAIAILANFVRLMALRDNKMARHLAEPALRHHDWLFHDRNNYGFVRNYMLQASMWIDPQWSAEQTRLLDQELSSDNDARPLELRSGLLEATSEIMDALER